MKVRHVVQRWLPLTQTWIHGHVAHCPGDHDVVADSVRNLDAFPATVHQRPDPGWRRRWHALDVAHHRAFMASLSEADVTHSHFAHWATRTDAHPHVVSVYGHDVDRVPRTGRQAPAWRRRYRALWKRVEAVICEGPHMASKVEALGCPSSKTRVVELGVDLARIPYREPPHPGRRFHVLIAASFREKKGIPDALLSLRGRPVRVTLIGDDDGTPVSQREAGRINAAIEMAGIPVERLGFVDHDTFRSVLRQADCFLQASKQAADGDAEGGAPVAITEARATGTPVVATNHCDIPHVVGDTAILAKEGDTKGLGAGVQALIDDHDLAVDLARRARADVEKRFDVRIQAQKWGRIHREAARA